MVTGISSSGFQRKTLIRGRQRKFVAAKGYQPTSITYLAEDG